MKMNEAGLVIETITPALAKKYLESMVQNRKRKDSLTVKYAMAMDDGAWVVNGETLKFNAEGQMIDGQHRCEACVLSDKAFTSYVARGVADVRAFATIDAGAVRTHGDIFSISGIKNANNMSAAASRIYAYKHGLMTISGTTPPRSAQAKRLVKGTDFVKANMDKTIDKKLLLEYAAPFIDRLTVSLGKAQSSHAGKLIPVSMAATLHFLFAEKSEPDADAFLTDLGQGIGLVENDPVTALRNKLIAHLSGHAKLMPNAKFLLCLYAWNKRRAGEKLKFLKLQEDAVFPKVR